jgi:hypothetical protein
VHSIRGFADRMLDLRRVNLLYLSLLDLWGSLDLLSHLE